MTFDQLLVAGLATWRFSHALLFEDGPFAVCTHIRSVIANDNNPLLVGLFSCIYCMSFWIGLLATWLTLSGLSWLLCPFAVSSAAILVQRYGAGTSSNSRHG